MLVGPQLPKKIRALASYPKLTFAAYGNDIAIFKCDHQVLERNGVTTLIRNRINPKYAVKNKCAKKPYFDK